MILDDSAVLWQPKDGWFASSPSHIEGEHAWKYNRFLIQFNWETHQNGDIENIQRRVWKNQWSDKNSNYRLQKNLDFWTDPSPQVPQVHQVPRQSEAATESQALVLGIVAWKIPPNFPPRFPNFLPEEAIYGYGSIPMKIPFLMGWTSINPSYFDVNYRGTRVLTHCHINLSLLKAPQLSATLLIFDAAIIESYWYWSYVYIPICSIVLVYLPTFGWFLG